MPVKKYLKKVLPLKSFWSNAQRQDKLIKTEISGGYSARIGNSCGAAEIIGGRYSQEDQILVEQVLPNFARLSDKSIKKPNQAQPESERETVIKEAFAAMQKQIEEKKFKHLGHSVGSTAIVTIQVGRQLYTASLGDSTAFLLQRDKHTGEILKCQRLNETLHNPDTDTIIPAANIREGRVGGMLNMTRSFGDEDLDKFGLSHDPDIYFNEIDTHNPNIEHLLITACDGLTEVAARKKYVGEDYENFEHVDEKYIVRLFKSLGPEAIGDKNTMESIARKLVAQASMDGSTDNISVVVKKLNPLDDTPKITAIYDGHNGSQVSNLLNDKKKGLVAILQAKIDQKLGLTKSKSIEKAAGQPITFVDALSNPINALMALASLDEANSSIKPKDKAKLLSKYRNDVEFLDHIATNPDIRAKIVALAASDKEVAEKLFLAKNYTVVHDKSVMVMAGKPSVFSASEIALILKYHAADKSFMNKILMPLGIYSNIDLAVLAKNDVGTLKTICATPLLAKRLGESKLNKIIYENYLNENHAPKFPQSIAKIKKLYEAGDDLNIYLAKACAKAGHSPAQFYLGLLYNFQATQYNKEEHASAINDANKECIYWLQKAAENAYPPATFTLAKIILDNPENKLINSGDEDKNLIYAKSLLYVAIDSLKTSKDSRFKQNISKLLSEIHGRDAEPVKRRFEEVCEKVFADKIKPLAEPVLETRTYNLIS